MEMSGYGVTLRLLTEDKIEMVRKWRNDPKIQQYMEYREEITPEMQKKWFEKISTSGKDYYFIIEYQGEEIGLINIKDIDFDKKQGEPGIFIWDDKFWGTDVPVRATFVRNEFIWNELKLERLVAHILYDNQRAINYNKMLGFKLAENQEKVYNQLYILKKNDSLKIMNRYKKYL